MLLYGSSDALVFRQKMRRLIRTRRFVVFAQTRGVLHACQNLVRPASLAGARRSGQFTAVHNGGGMGEEGLCEM